MPTEAKLLTADELLFGGVEHGLVEARIVSHLERHVREHGLGFVVAGGTGFRIGLDDSVQVPDGAFIEAARFETTRGYFRGAPDLAIEVVAAHELFTDVEEKIRRWVAAGTRMVIVIMPDNESVEVIRGRFGTPLTIDDTLSGADVVPGWSLPLRELFA